MQYLDSGDRDPQNSLAHWLTDILNEAVCEIRIQSGFFSINGIGPFINTLERFRANNLPLTILLGSNESSTLQGDIVTLAEMMGLPRASAQMGIVSFNGAFFHPKTYHFTREDGSQAAFVGSANLSASGLALHVEAGIVLDTNEGDSPDHLRQISNAIDRWFIEDRAGITLINEQQDIDRLVDNGILATAPPRTPTQGGNGGERQRNPRPRIRPLFELPQLPRDEAPDVEREQPAQDVPAETIASVPRNGFPHYLLFEPNAAGPTTSGTALSGASLPGRAHGLIVQLNRDSARHFMGRTGTANISIPVATVSTLRFGIRGRHSRPACLFNLHMRYIGDEVHLHGETRETSLMAYGFTENETGHGDIRMVVPAAARHLCEEIEENGLTPPTAGDLALLEWPTQNDPDFRITFIERQSPLYEQVSNAFNAAAETGQLVSQGACWLTVDFAPEW